MFSRWIGQYRRATRILKSATSGGAQLPGETPVEVDNYHAGKWQTHAAGREPVAEGHRTGGPEHSVPKGTARCGLAGRPTSRRNSRCSCRRCRRVRRSGPPAASWSMPRRVCGSTPTSSPASQRFVVEAFQGITAPRPSLPSEPRPVLAYAYAEPPVELTLTAGASNRKSP